jgi:hypothetical protein
MPTEEEQYQQALAAYYAEQEAMGGMPVGSSKCRSWRPKQCKPS